MAAEIIDLTGSDGFGSGTKSTWFIDLCSTDDSASESGPTRVEQSTRTPLIIDLTCAEDGSSEGSLGKRRSSSFRLASSGSRSSQPPRYIPGTILRPSTGGAKIRKASRKVPKKSFVTLEQGTPESRRGQPGRSRGPSYSPLTPPHPIILRRSKRIAGRVGITEHGAKVPLQDEFLQGTEPTAPKDDSGVARSGIHNASYFRDRVPVRAPSFGPEINRLQPLNPNRKRGRSFDDGFKDIKPGPRFDINKRRRIMKTPSQHSDSESEPDFWPIVSSPTFMKSKNNSLASRIVGDWLENTEVPYNRKKLRDLRDDVPFGWTPKSVETSKRNTPTMPPPVHQAAKDRPEYDVGSVVPDDMRPVDRVLDELRTATLPTKDRANNVELTPCASSSSSEPRLRMDPLTIQHAAPLRPKTRGRRSQRVIA